VIAVVSVIVAAGIGVGIGAAIAPGNPVAAAKATVSQAIATGVRAGTFHYDQLSTTDGEPYDIDGEASPHGGRQLITSGSSIYTLLLVHGTVYFKGNEAAMVSALGVPSAKAHSDANRYISVPKSASPYHSFEVGITTRSNLSQIPDVIVARSQTSGPNGSTVVHGSLDLGSGAPPSGKASLTISSAGLPTRLSGQATFDGVSSSDTWTFDAWHGRVVVSAPKTAIAYASLGATPPSPSGGGAAPSAGGGGGGGLSGSGGPTGA